MSKYMYYSVLSTSIVSNKIHRVSTTPFWRSVQLFPFSYYYHSTVQYNQCLPSINYAQSCTFPVLCYFFQGQSISPLFHG